jgi:hypothetical protein
LLSLLDDSETEVINSGSPDDINPAILLNDLLEENASSLLGGETDNLQETSSTTEHTGTESITQKFPLRKLIKRPRSTTTTPTTTTTTETPTTASTTTSTTTTTTTTAFPETLSTPSTTATTTQQVLPLEHIREYDTTSIKRADTNVESLKEIAPPSQQDLVLQLSLLNSLLQSLGDNATSGGPSEIPQASPKQDEVSLASPKQDEIPSESKPIEVKPTPDLNDLLKALSDPANAKSSAPAGANTPGKVNDPAAALQSLALLNTLFGGSNANNPNNPAAAALLGLGANGGSNLATMQTQQKSGQSDADAAAALTELLKQSGAFSGQNGNPALQNFQNTNANMDTASSNQVAGLLSLLGTLGSLSQQPQQSNSLFNFGQNNPVQPQQTNFLTTLLNQQQPQAQANALGNLFGSSSQPQSQAFNLGNIFAGQQNAASSIPGLGLLSTVGSLGSSLVSTMSNILGGSGLGGKPRVRGKGKAYLFCSYAP